MKAIVMAAGKGTRLATDGVQLPKVLREANGKPLLGYVLDSINSVYVKDTVIVVGYMSDKVERAYPQYKCVKQGDDAYGTGYAVMCAMADESMKGYDGDIMILNGDMPMVTKETVDGMSEYHRATGAECTLFSCISKQYLPYGRIIRNSDGEFAGIVEENDCTDEQKKIMELNVGLYVIKANSLRSALKKIKNDNAKREYYLTDVPSVLAKENSKISVYVTEDQQQMLGVNTPEDLKTVGDYLANRQSKSEN